jgi:hypothetical protein
LFPTDHELYYNSIFPHLNRFLGLKDVELWLTKS